MIIRNFKIEDYAEICRWSDEEFGFHPAIDHISPTSFIAEINNNVKSYNVQQATAAAAAAAATINVH
jgi:hypothetical protein